MRIFFRDSLANFFRRLPSFRGKSKLGSLLISLFTNKKIEKECIRTIQMRDGSIMEIDLRNFEKEAFFTGEYDYSLIQKLLKILESGCTILDVGANIGFYSITLGNQLKRNFKGSTIWSFEPIQSNFERLTRLIRANQLEDVIYPVNIALGNQEGEVSFHLENEANTKTGNAFLVKNSSPASTNCKAYMTKLDDFSAANSIDKCVMIKVDIEGGELDFLLGSKNFIAKHQPIILSEFNSYFAQQLGYSFQDFSSLLKSYNYKLYFYDRVKDNFFDLENELAETNVANILMIPQGNPRKNIVNLLLE